MDNQQATKALINDAIGYIDLVLTNNTPVPLSEENERYLKNCRILLARAAE